jgi:copper resistance protein C
MRRLLAVLGAAAVACVAALVLATPASAHDVLVGSDPARGGTVTTGPSQVRLDFNAPVQFGADEITVLGPDGGHYERTQTATVTGNSVSTAVAPLGPAGTYTVGYRIISADGHPVSGEITFTLATAGTGAPVTPKAAGAAPGSGSGGGGVPVWVWIVGAVVLLAIGLFVALRGGRTPEAAARSGDGER